MTKIGTVEKLEAVIRRKIVENRKESVEFSKEQENFASVVAKGMGSLVRSLEIKIEPAFTSLSRMQWEKLVSVDDQSPYVDQISQAIRQTVPNYHSFLTSNRFKFFCDSFVKYLSLHFLQFCTFFVHLSSKSSFIPKLSSNILMCNRMSVVGAEQLLLDVTTIKEVLFELPKQGLERVTSRYNKYVRKEFDKLEKLIKVPSSKTQLYVITNIF